MHRHRARGPAPQSFARRSASPSSSACSSVFFPGLATFSSSTTPAFPAALGNLRHELLAAAKKVGIEPLSPHASRKAAGQ
jgi:hypothetical protein